MPTIRRRQIRQFQQHLYDEIKNLPVVVTRKGKDAFLVMSWTEEDQANTQPKNAN